MSIERNEIMYAWNEPSPDKKVKYLLINPAT